jgi:hypothetical protein
MERVTEKNISRIRVVPMGKKDQWKANCNSRLEVLRQGLVKYSMLGYHSAISFEVFEILILNALLYVYIIIHLIISFKVVLRGGGG